MKVLVTGGAGYIGATTVQGLLEAGHEVVVYDNLSNGYAEAVPKSVKLVQGDVGDRERLDSLFREHRLEAVLHFAALIEAGESMKVPEKFFRNNSSSTLTLLESMLTNGVTKFIFSSTAALYGEPERIPIREEDTLKPTNAYGESKLLVERMLAWFHRIHGFRYASLRYFNAAGSNGRSGESHNPESHLIPLILQVASGQREHISIFGTDYPTQDGTCVRDYVHVSDLADAHVLALEALESRDKLIYNLGSGAGFSVRQVIDSARRITGKPIKVIESARRPGDPAVLVASSDKIRKELKWRPKYPELDQIVSTAWDWMQKHPHGYAELATTKSL
ncbi:MAG TPA: UDP-glucose 4-epimerase GalE [Terriglobales bacterium]|jgi:UDP-glucose 4-epimerase|nr:UDP-glucose 4-epimerase GalE [Terriglobales bacterium]